MPQQTRHYLLLSVVLAALGTYPAMAEEKPVVPNVSVEAEGKVTAVPDLATLDLEVETQAPQAQAAAQENAKRAEQLLKALKQVLPPEEKVKTLGYLLVPVQAPKDKSGLLVIKGYQVMHRFQLQVLDPGRVSTVIDTALGNGASQVSGPYWGHSHLEELQRQAAVDAFQKAREMAATLAQAAGLKIKGVQQLNIAVRLPLPRAPYEGMLAQERSLAAAPTPIEVGEEDIKANVQAVFQLSP
jgi:uncharacterized protein YggE